MRSMTEGLFLQETTPQSPVGDSSPCTGEPKNAQRVVEGADPYRKCAKRAPNRRALSVSRRPVREQTKPSPVGKVSTKLTNEGLQAVGTAWCEVLLCTVPHQSPTAPASPKGSQETNPTENAENPPNRRAGARSRRDRTRTNQAFPLGGRWCVCTG